MKEHFNSQHFIVPAVRFGSVIACVCINYCDVGSIYHILSRIFFDPWPLDVLFQCVWISKA